MPQEKPLSPQDQLEADIRLAILEKDAVSVVASMRGKSFSETFRNDVLGGLIAMDDAVDAVRFVVEEQKTDVGATRLMFLLNAACQRGFADTALYLSQKAMQEGVTADDCYQRIFSHFAPDVAAGMADKLADTMPDRQAALSDMMLSASLSKSYATLGALSDIGAVAGKHLPIVLLALSMCEDETLFKDEAGYSALFDKITSSVAKDQLSTLDIMLPVIAYKIPEENQYPAVLQSLLQHGADPFGMHAEAARYLVKTFNEKADYTQAENWQTLFDREKESITGQYRRQFDQLYAKGFDAGDLQKTINEEGDTGLTLAVKAGALPQMWQALQPQTDKAPIDIDMLFAQTSRKQSALSTAIDRGTVTDLLLPAYWLKQDENFVQTIESRLTEDQKKWADLDAVVARVDQYKLKQQAGRYKLGPRRPGQP